MKEIPLSKGKVALVDDSDYEELSKHKWSAHRGKNGVWYASRGIVKPSGGKRTILMHRYILALTDPTIKTDHIDHNGLNNQNTNLRICSNSNNSANQRKWKRKTTSRFKGVYWHKHSNRWRSQIKVNQVPYYLGCYKSESDAAQAYNEAAIKRFGEFAHLNAISD